MDKEVAKNLVREVLQNPFNKEKFIYLLKNILQRYDESKAFHARGYVKQKFKSLTQVVKTYERVGTYIDPQDKKVDLLIVYLQKENSLERARTTLRNFVADYLKQRDMKDAALVAFVSPDKDDWRFSFVKMQYKFDEQGKVREEFTPARRYSFLVGKNEKSHTAQSRLLPLLLDDHHKPTLEEIEEVFKVEPVTKEFFQKYRELFLRLKESLDDIIKKDSRIQADFQKKNINSVDFAKKLLGQIVFLYFLQKKGWFGVEKNKDWGTGDKNFLRSLFEKKIVNYENFFNDVLEPLFYEALRRTERSGDYYSRFDCKIPFLNGGLFDPIGDYDWQNTDILFPNHLFSNNQRTKEGDIGDGILDIFDRYNFTVKEDEPLEKEVAIDPEMLGKVFENLLEVRDRKSKGTYYTPREIVHYMCQESLINYLATELTGKVDRKDIETLIKYGENVVEHDSTVAQKGQETTRYSFKLPKSVRENAKLIDDILASVRVCDPAVGSGAFLVSMMNEIVKTRMTLTPYIGESKTRTPYYFKRHAIQNCLYGVDIDPGAIEICKLRLWLSLVVDEEDIKNIKPLPNLDYKIMQGDSLISEFMGIDLDKELENKNSNLGFIKDELNDLIEKLKNKKNEYLNASSITEKQRLKEEIEDLIIKIFETKLSKQKSDYFNELKHIEEKYKILPNEKQRKSVIKKEKEKLYKKFGFNLDQFEKQLREYTSGNKIRPFFPWKLYFAEVFQEKGGFDIVIANPPYIGEKGHKEIFRKTKKGPLGKFFMGKMDYFYFFFHLSLNIAKDNAIVSFITTNYYPTATGGKKLRQDFKERAIIKNLMNFNELKIFESALGQHNMITILQKGQNENAIAKTCITQRRGFATHEILYQILNGQDKETQYYQVSQKDLYDGDEYYIRLEGVSNSLNNPIQKVLDKIKSQGVPLGNICNVNQGIVTGADKVSRKHIEKYGIKANVGDGIFVLSDDEIRNLTLTKHDKEILKPWFKNSDIFRWDTKNQSTEHIFYIDRNIQALGDNIKKHLQQYKAVLSRRREVENGVIEWWQLQWPREQSIFEKEKIVAPQRSPRNTFGYNEIPWYAASDVFFITEKDKSISLKYILALLNSKLYYRWLYHRGKRKGETLELIAKPLSEIPIKKISRDEQKPFINLVDKILAITKDDDYLKNSAKQAKVHEYEKQLDLLVYKLYNLTEEEIKIVEQNEER